MNKATLSRLLKVAAGNTLAEVQVLDKTTGVVYVIRDVNFDEQDKVFYIGVAEKH